jgi:hypothetical protein
VIFHPGTTASDQVYKGEKNIFSTDNHKSFVVAPNLKIRVGWGGVGWGGVGWGGVGWGGVGGGLSFWQKG